MGDEGAAESLEGAPNRSCATVRQCTPGYGSDHKLSLALFEEIVRGCNGQWYWCWRSDHRKLGAELDLFSINDMGGAGLVFWHPKVDRLSADLIKTPDVPLRLKSGRRR